MASTITTELPMEEQETSGDQEDVKKINFENILEDSRYKDKGSSKGSNHLAKVKSIIASKNPPAIPYTVCCEASLQSDIFWDVCVEVCQKITQETYEESEALFDACEESLTYLVKEGNHKEILYVLSEQIWGAPDSLAYRVFMDHVRKLVNCLPLKQRNLSCDTLLSSASHYINSLELPKPNLNLEGDERKIVAYDPKVRIISESLDEYLRMMAVYVDCDSLDEHMKWMIVRRLFHVFHHQLVLIHIGYSDVDNVKHPSGYCHDSAQKLLSLLSKMFPDFYKLLRELIGVNERIDHENKIKIDDDSVEKQEDGFTDVSIGCFLYLVLGELMNVDNWPSVVSHLTTLDISLPFIISLLKRTEDLIVYKGIFLAETLISKFSRRALELSVLEKPNFIELTEILVAIMLHCNVVEYRQRSLKLFDDYIQRFNQIARYRIYYHVIKRVTHAGVIGHVIGLIKDEVDYELKQATPNDCFRGDKLEELVIPTLDLPDGTTTDLLTESDRLIAGLNFIRYLCIRDAPRENSTGFWSRADKIMDLFLEPLKNCIIHSRLNYKTELEETLKNKRVKREDEAEIEVRVGDTVVPPVLHGRHIEIMEGGLRMFDLMESLHARVVELIHTNRTL